MTLGTIRETIAAWRLPPGGDLLERIESMIEPALLAGQFGSSPTQIVCGLQYHLGGAEDTRQLADLAQIGPADHVLDVCCFLGGPAVQLAASYGCRVTGIDISETAILGARRIAALAGLEERLAFEVTDAAHMPFADGAFDVIWNQGSLNHDPAWLAEFDRLLRPGGRLALVFQVCPAQTPPNPDDHPWTLEEMAARVRAMGYRVHVLDDLTEREIVLGWEALAQRLEERRDVYAAALGEGWVQEALAEFQEEIAAMRRGAWSNGRMIATKPDAR